jgi:arylsulfatase A-like enzyme
MLRRLAAADEVKNVVLFVADSVRADALPEPVAAAGTTAETVAPSTFTATSVPSLLTGQYPVGHRVWGFGDQLDRPPALVEAFDEVTYTAPLFGREFDEPREKPVLRVLNLPDYAVAESESSTTLPFVDGSVSTPFCYLEHHHGGHVVYGDPERDDRVRDQSAAEYCRAVGGDDERLRADYDRGVTAAGRRFLEIRDELKNGGLLSETLLVFTSDHGEARGEHGVFTHGAPMTPEVVRVPTVFCGAGLPDASLDRLTSGVDLTPTLLSAAERAVPNDPDGIDLWTQSPADGRVVESHQWVEYDHAGYKAAGAWTTDGGVVRHYNGVRERLFAFALELLRRQTAPLVRRRPVTAARLATVYLRRTLQFGSSPPPVSSLRPDDAFRRTDHSRSVKATGRLEALGYIED